MFPSNRYLGLLLLPLLVVASLPFATVIAPAVLARATPVASPTRLPAAATDPVEEVSLVASAAPSVVEAVTIPPADVPNLAEEVRPHRPAAETPATKETPETPAPTVPAVQTADRVVLAAASPTPTVEPTVSQRRNLRPVSRQPIQLPILMYHYVRVNPNPSDQLGFNLSVTPTDLAVQLDYLAQQGYRGVALTALTGFLSGEQEEPPPPRSVVLTFDDGYRDAYEQALPLLRKHGFSATVFMIAGLVGRPGYLTADQLREMADSGIDIGAHTVNHPDLTRVGPAGARREIAESKALLEKEVGRPVLTFAYPSGRYNAGVVEIVKEAGYQGAVTVNYGLTHSAEERFALARVRVSGGQLLSSVMRMAGIQALPAAARD